MDLTTLKNQICTYIDSVSGQSLTPSSFLKNGVDTLLLAINAAHHNVQKDHDFFLASVTPSLSVANIGTDLSNATLNGSTIDVKRVTEVLLSVSDGEFPIEFLSQDTHLSRLRMAIGKQRYDPLATMASIGVADDAPHATQNGNTLFLHPAAQFTFPVTVTLNVVRFMPDYTGPATIVVSGSGTSAINATYEQYGIYNDHPFYFSFQTGAAVPATVYALWNSGTAWVLTTASEFGKVAATNRYTSTENAETPEGLTYTLTGAFGGSLAIVAVDGNVSTDFLLDHGWEYLQWAAILELNKQWKEFVDRAEGNIPEDSVAAMAAAALQSFLAWDISISKGTTAPELEALPT